MSKSYDIVVLGGGIGGYSAAIRAAQFGKSVAIVERDKLGGTCLHRGCIPSKALLKSAELYARLKEGDTYGITVGEVGLNYEKVLARKNDIVEQLYKGVQYLMKKNKIDVLNGNGRIVPPSIFSPKSGTVAVEQEDGETITVEPGHLIIATGSKPRLLPGLEANGETISTSDHAVHWNELPRSVIIVGGGVIGVEWASLLHDFGVEVTIVETESRLLALEDEDISKELQKEFSKRGIQVLTDTRIDTHSINTEKGQVSLSASRNEETIELKAEKMLISVGREANLDQLGLENTDVKLANGFVKVNANLQTAESHIYAIGDCIGGVQLAHSASYEGIAAVDHIVGQKPHHYPPHQIPRCTYARPESASIGFTEKQAREQGISVQIAKVPFRAIGKAVISGEPEGFAKVIADKDSGDLLGLHLIGHHATDLISEAALAQLLDATPWEMSMTIHPHPSASEIIGEAMLAVQGKSMSS
ncbi:dihydrolipoyl dehydrogenase [Paenibacillus senegalensis]|uniref:dihydrolipoyl dehydrogenase n=1 Tax=Paenibacillus senegalensis TaxID=1465766 RepID=UPI000288223C|nr:dihydrolipoyl dehydrogenase [Paenibacillus senegalensis]